MASQAKRQWSHVDEYATTGYRIRFEPIADCPGCTHRVFILDTSAQVVWRDWLGSGFPPSAKVASFFLDKHLAPK